MKWTLLSFSIAMACAGCATTPEVTAGPNAEPAARSTPPLPAPPGPEPAAAECLPIPPPPPSDGTTPLDRAEVQRVMKLVKPCVLECHRRFGQPGIALLTMTVAQGGEVRHATVQGALAGSPTADCVALAARKARFRAASNELTFSYPIMLR